MIETAGGKTKELINMQQKKQGEAWKGAIGGGSMWDASIADQKSGSVIKTSSCAKKRKYFLISPKLRKLIHSGGCFHLRPEK